MKIILRAVGTKMPYWVQEGFNDYQKPFPQSLYHFSLQEGSLLGQVQNVNTSEKELYIR